MRRLAIALISAVLMGVAGLAVAAPNASATPLVSADTTNPGTTVAAATDSAPVPTTAAPVGGTGTAASLAPVDVLQVSGLFDAVVVESIEQAITRSEHNGAQALILQLSSDGAVVSRATMSRLVSRVADAKVAIGIWVGPSTSSRAYGLPAQLFAVADVTAMVAGSRIGDTGAPLTYDGKTVDFGASTDALRSGSMSFKEARAAGVLHLDTPDLGVPTVRNMVLALNGVTVDGKVLHTVVQELQPNGGQQATSTLVRFHGLGLTEQLMHTVASPAMAYLLFVIGLSLLIFEFFTAGVGIAGGVGAVCMIFGCYGFAELPVRPIALVALVLAMLAFAIDVQVGVPRFWTALGVLVFAAGSWTLYESIPGTDLRLGWITLFVGVIGVILTFVIGMPSMTRTRFSAPLVTRADPGLTRADPSSQRADPSHERDSD